MVVQKFLLRVILVASLVIPSIAVANQSVETWEDEYILSIPKNSSKKRAKWVHVTVDLKTLLRKEGVGKAKRQRIKRTLKESKAVDDCRFLLRALKDIKGLRCEPNLYVELAAIPNDPRYPSLYGMGAISAPDVWNRTTGSSDVVVAVLDTGVDHSHPDLSVNAWVNEDEIPGNGIDDDGNGYVDDVNGWDFANNDSDPMDDHGHGTHCAGTIAAAGNNNIGVTGVSWNARIMGLKFLTARGGGSIGGAIQAIDYAIENGANIINASWGGYGRSEALSGKIQDAFDAGVLFVAAAGNSGLDTDSLAHYPSGYQWNNIVSVAASDSKDDLASFSNRGLTTVDLAAPGVSILSTWPGGGYTQLSGTSMAAPHVAGAAALLLSEQPDLSVSELRSKLIASVEKKKKQLQGKVASSGRLYLPALFDATSGGSGDEDGEVQGAVSIESQRPNTRQNGRVRLSVSSEAEEPYSLRLAFLDGRYTCDLATGLEGSRNIAMKVNLPNALRFVDSLVFSAIGYGGASDSVSVNFNSRSRSRLRQRRRLTSLSEARIESIVSKACNKMRRASPALRRSAR